MFLTMKFSKSNILLVIGLVEKDFIQYNSNG
ncbi:hypothetical protein SAMN05192546_10342 [Tindallia californiensis]|uniref:Uncharacterized protein n=1 Tax=Tindallia californiensis TaxID=159292 RepID=A0A1H3L3M8_9FIRM|nr:hypothetical protein SAMN05192546_10342 [Tindallia californiensis]